MPPHKRASAPETSLPSIPSLLWFERSALASCTRSGTCAVKSALARGAWTGHRWTKGMPIVYFCSYGG